MKNQKRKTVAEFFEALENLENTVYSIDVTVKRKDGNNFRIIFYQNETSPLDVKGIDTNITTKEVLDTIKERREVFKV